MESTTNLRVIDMTQIHKELESLKTLCETETDISKKLKLLSEQRGILKVIELSIGIMQPKIHLVRI